ncbi:hypothetical protein KS4_34200 [Poriferisphaera corsica]|uniref:Uncharacterized protein n=1 Tax=Poriferisphaera corsica TaxID=2528020 RepID=A0A517YYQ8_9BACT|nr:hypothetical protein [Poriferisphaera corsica]QDU35339.1 hypothetical protein KS4_34200 [Poriferisphaera corsica]
MTQLADNVKDRTAQMHCPLCNALTHEVRHPKYKDEVAYYCPECNWGKEKADKLALGNVVHKEPESMHTQYIMVPSYIRIGFSLIASAVLLSIPYLMIVLFWPLEGGLPVPFHIAYWILALIYLAAAYYEDPRIYEDWDVWAFDNPFKLNDQTNRTSTVLTIALIPGKLLVWSLSALLGRIVK